MEINELAKSKSPDYLNRYRVIQGAAPCSYKKAELVEQLNDAEAYENDLKE